MNPIKTIGGLFFGSAISAASICIGMRGSSGRKGLDLDARLKDIYPFTLDLMDKKSDSDPVWNLIAYRNKNSLQEIFNLEFFDRSKSNWRENSSVFGKGIFYFCKSLPEKRIRELVMNLKWGENINGKIEKLIYASQKWCVDPGSSRNIGEKLIFEGKNIRYDDNDALDLYKNNKEKLKTIFNFKKEITTKEDMIGAGKVIIQWCKLKFKENWTSGVKRTEEKLLQSQKACILESKLQETLNEPYEGKINY